MRERATSSAKQIKFASQYGLSYRLNSAVAPDQPRPTTAALPLFQGIPRIHYQNIRYHHIHAFTQDRNRSSNDASSSVVIGSRPKFPT